MTNQEQPNLILVSSEEFELAALAERSRPRGLPPRFWRAYFTGLAIYMLAWIAAAIWGR